MKASDMGDDLQWGRGQTAAERRKLKFPRARPPPSMGPRPNGRGKWQRHGPPQSRGAFNGAAAKRPRKAAALNISSKRALSFNGAAAKRPRKD